MPPPENLWNLEAMRLLLRPFLGQKRCFSEVRRQSFTSVHEHLPVAPYSTAWFRLSDRSLISQATPFADRSVHGKNGKLLKESVFRTVRSHLVLCCNMSPRCVRAMGVCRALALFGEGKSGPVETGLTGPVATALTDYKWCL